MKLNVLLFGPYADAASRSAAEVVLPGDVSPTADAVKAALAAEHPALRGMLPSAVLAVNHRAVGPGHVVRETDELAIIGLVGGG